MATQEEGDAPDAAEGTPKYAIGTRVRKFFEGNGWFSGSVVSHDGTYYCVEYDDGDEEEYNDQELSQIILTRELSKVTIGSRVAVYQSSNDQYSEATVVRERVDRKPLLLEFDDGGGCQWVNLREEQFVLLEECAPRRRIRLQTPKKKSARKEESAGGGSSYSDLAGIVIGSKIAVYRPITDQYYEATVTQEQDGDNRFYCEYTSGNGEWVDLRQRDFIVLEGQSEINDSIQDSKEDKQEKPQAESLPLKEEDDAPKKESSSARRHDNADAAKDTPPIQQEPIEPLSDLDKVGIGSRVAVYRPNDEQYYEAVVTRQRFIKKPFLLEYTNGDREWVDFRQHKFILLKEEQDAPGRRSRRRSEKRKGVSAASPPSNKNVSEGNKRRRIETNKGKAKAVGKGSGRLKHCNNSFNMSRDRKQTTGTASEAKGKSKDAMGTKAPKDGAGTIVKGKQKYDVGTKVKKFFRCSGWFYGEVVSFNGWFYRVLYSDGDKEDYNEQDLDDIVLSSELEQAQVGMRVAVHWPADNKFYEATIARESMTSKTPYYLEYDTGHYEWLDLGKVKFCVLGGGTRRRSDTIAEDECNDSDAYDEAGEDSDA